MNCKGCGKCCWLVDPYLDVQIKPSEVIAGDLTEERYGYGNEYGVWMKRRLNGSCVALDLETNLCMIYENRPIECREFGIDHEVCRRILST